jgi:hypothetical protein
LELQNEPQTITESLCWTILSRTKHTKSLNVDLTALDSHVLAMHQSPEIIVERKPEKILYACMAPAWACLASQYHFTRCVAALVWRVICREVAMAIRGIEAVDRYSILGVMTAILHVICPGMTAVPRRDRQLVLMSLSGLTAVAATWWVQQYKRRSPLGSSCRAAGTVGVVNMMLYTQDDE